MVAEHLTAIPPLTAKTIEAARPGAKDYEIADAGAPGLRLRITPKGARVFRWHVTRGGRQQVVTIGRWSKNPQPGRVTLAEARSCLEKLKIAHRAGTLDEVLLAELAATRPARTPPEPAAGPLTVRELAADFIVYIERRRKRPEQARRPIELDILPVLGDRALSSITSRDVRQVVEAVVARGSPTQAGAVLAVAKQLFRFAQGRDELVANPAAVLDPGALGVVRNRCQRYLTPEEIAAFWAALDACKGMTPTVRIGLKLLLLLGVRSGELLLATWDEVDFDTATWVIPVAHQKSTKAQEERARPWAVPLSPMALELFRELKALADSLRSPNVMASFHAGGEPLTEKALNHAMRRLFEGKAPLLTFPGERPTPHDLRRTMRTHMGDLGVSFHVAERCLNHSLGKIADIYDRGDYLAERRAALEKWSLYLGQLVGGGAL
jgi:integrase